MPGHAIPEPFKWDESFRTFYDQIDKEHQGLFDGIFACCEKPGDAATLADLVRLIDEHFAAEEATMQKKNYAGYADHKKIHGEFTKKLKELKAPLTDANLHFAKEWLVNHIKDVDFKYKDKL